MDKLPSNILALCLNLLDAKDLVNCRNVGATEFSTSGDSHSTGRRSVPGYLLLSTQILNCGTKSSFMQTV